MKIEITLLLGLLCSSIAVHGSGFVSIQRDIEQKAKSVEEMRFFSSTRVASLDS